MVSHINPQFRRNNITSLSGAWSFRFDENKVGEKEKYYLGFEKQYDINVPFSYTCKDSNVNIQKHVDVIWYSKEIELTKEDLLLDLYLNCEGIDEIATIYLNGHFVGKHIGGNSSFKVLLNSEAKVGKNLIVIKVEDDYSLAKARGKQRWEDYMYGCWYVPTYGIYKPIYLERVNHTHLDYFKLTPKMDEALLDIDYVINNYVEGLKLKVTLKFKDTTYRELITTVDEDSGRISLNLNSSKFEYQVRFWAPHDPNLYDLELELIKDEKTIDKVYSYFGVSEYIVSGNNVLLNGFSYISKMVLYQGYSKDGYLTPKGDEEMIKDINNIKSLGFSGIRCHQYIPTERFLYLCDAIGLSVWIEYPSQHLFNQKAKETIVNEWKDIIKVKSNHPSVFAYVIYNESWGIRGVKSNKEQQDFVDMMYRFTKAFDPNRIVISNDGWEHVSSDIVTLHNYYQDAKRMEQFYKGERHLCGTRDDFAFGYEKDNKPIFLTEYGGCSLGKIDSNNGEWGYGNGANNLEEFYNRFASFAEMMKNVGFKGYCYTQYRDVQQEKNGLADEEGNLKVDPTKIKKIIDEIY